MRLAYGFILSLCLFALPAAAQKHDYTWLAGYGSELGYSSNWNYWFGITSFDFTEDTMTISFDSLDVNFDRANCIMSDENGNLLFYANGVTVYNALDRRIENGDSLGMGFYLQEFDPGSLDLGFRFNNGAICLPIDESRALYQYFVLKFDSFMGSYTMTQLRVHTIDMHENAGLGKMIARDDSILIFPLNYSFDATRHGNGKDWWVITWVYSTSCFKLLHIGANGVQNIYTKCGTGSVLPYGQTGVMNFSNDGNTLVCTSNTGLLDVYDFDRCNGNITLKEQAPLPSDFQNGLYAQSIEFSPDSRFCYVFANKYAYQYDMQAIPIGSSLKTVATADTFMAPLPFGMYHGQLAPDGKIYSNSGSTNYYISVVNNPNMPDTLCDFRIHSIQTPSFISGLPYYPNYRLGAKTGSPCDTLTSLNEIPADKLLQVYPNPATDYLYADYGYLPWDKYKNEITLQITDATGRIVYAQELPKYSGIQKLDVRAFPQGIYYLSLLHNHQPITTRKWVKGE